MSWTCWSSQTSLETQIQEMSSTNSCLMISIQASSNCQALLAITCRLANHLPEPLTQKFSLLVEMYVACCDVFLSACLSLSAYLEPISDVQLFLR